MTDAVYMDFEEPAVPTRRDAGGDSGKKKGKKGKKKAEKAFIPTLPTPEKPLTGDEIRKGVSDRNRAAAKYKTLGYSYLEIADLLEFDSAQDAKRAVEAVIAATMAPEEIEMQRAIVLSRGEMLLKQSLAMATADFLVTEDGERIPNDRKLAWHQQAASDLMNIATLTGAKAPTKVEFTPGEAELESLVNRIVLRSGHEDIVDAEVIELDTIPQIERGVDADDDDEVRG